MIEILRPSTVPAIEKEPDCYLTFYRTGRIRLSADLTRAMLLEPDDRVVFISLDGHHYLAPSAKEDAYKLCGQGALHIQSRDLYAELSRRFDLPPVKRVRLQVAQAPQYINDFKAHEILLP